ncbi:uncharacterized protein CEXT_575631 [Caerostris extrusa]|uniref:Uncharacterized protein n=1 Tax=Caerostris extrusa TaxID=172846 RepID=A0AAV4XRJ2_CAEEX|nr:uncharacterized protein CEXT_575631 [Caerostris extrusa]
MLFPTRFIPPESVTYLRTADIVIGIGASKKSRAQNEKKVLLEKKESFSYEEQNDDGWVQLISKKGRKNRKKDDAAASETNAPSVTKVTEAAKSDDNSPIEESPKKHTGSSKDKKQSAPIDLQEKSAKDVKVASVEKPKMQNVVVEVSKPDKAEKQPKKETAAKEIKALEESNKSKKKKKKNADVIPQVNEPAGNISSTISDSSAKQVISENVAPTKITPNITDVAELPPLSSDKVEANKSSDPKSSNVAFDELSGLYPETKEQKKKKKVRRDH